jgi:hypothetical protein
MSICTNVYRGMDYACRTECLWWVIMGLGPCRVGLCNNISSFMPIMYKNWSFLPYLILETKIAHHSVISILTLAAWLLWIPTATMFSHLSPTTLQSDLRTIPLSLPPTRVLSDCHLRRKQAFQLLLCRISMSHCSWWLAFAIKILRSSSPLRPAKSSVLPTSPFQRTQLGVATKRVTSSTFLCLRCIHIPLL